MTPLPLRITNTDGAVYVYKRSGSTWARRPILRRLIAMRVIILAGVSLDQDTLAVVAFKRIQPKHHVDSTTASTNNSIINQGQCMSTKEVAALGPKKPILRRLIVIPRTGLASVSASIRTPWLWGYSQRTPTKAP